MGLMKRFYNNKSEKPKRLISTQLKEYTMGKFDLSKLKKNWEKAKKVKVKSGYDEFDDGRYVAKVSEAKLAESDSSGRPQINWKFTFLEGEYKGKKKMDFQGLDTETNIAYAMKRLAQMGKEDVELEELEDILKEVVEESPICRIHLKTKGEFQNVYLDKVLTQEEAEGDESEGSEEIDGEEEKEEVEETEEEDEEETEEEEEVVEEEEDAVQQSSAKSKKHTPAKPTKKHKDPEEEDEEEEVPDEPVDAEDDDEEEEAEEETEEVGLVKGMRVSGKSLEKGKDVEGTVIKVMEKEGKAKIETDQNKIHTLLYKDITVIEEVEEEEEESEDEDEEELPKKKVIKNTSTIKRKK